MNAIFKIMAFSIMLNFATGLMMVALPDVFTAGNTAGLEYDDTAIGAFEADMGGNVTPGGNLEDAGDQYDRVLDVLSLGIIQRIVKTVNTFAFGIIEVFRGLVGNHLAPAMNTFLFGPPVGLLKGVLSFAYIIGAFTLWTGRRIND